MDSHLQISTLHGSPVVIKLEVEEALECLGGGIWVSLVARKDTDVSSDELLYAGDLLVSSHARTYCLSNLHKTTAYFRVIAREQVRSARERDSPRQFGSCYTIIKGALGAPEGALI